MKYPKLAGKMMQVQLNKEFAYKTNFIITIIGMTLGDFIGPLMAMIIYGTTVGIPGWTLDQFLLFQGTLIFVFGLGHALWWGFFWVAFEAIERGDFDKYLLKPYNSWLYIAAAGIDWDGFIEVIFGLVLIIYAMIKLQISITNTGFFYYLVLIGAAVLFQSALMTFVTAGSFIAVKNEALYNLFMRMFDFARYPLTVYGVGLRIFLTFFFPVAVSSFYPAEALIRGMGVAELIMVIMPVIAVFCISLWAWHRAIRKYTSAGG